jgi:oligopeptidase A
MNNSPFLEFDINLDTFIDNLTQMLDNNQKSIDNLLSIEDKSYANFIKPFELLDERLDQFFTPLSHINAVNNSQKSQDVYAQSLPLLSAYHTQIGQNIDIFRAIESIKEREYDKLNYEQQRVIDLNILHFKLSGAHLDDEKKKRLKEINLRKSELSNDFSQNVLDATNAYEKIITDEADIKGLSQSDIESAKDEIDGKTIWRFTLQMPSYIAYMTYGENAEIREELYRAYTTRAPQNAKIIDELLALRLESAQILGFKSYAELSLASKMAPDTDTVINFLQELAEKSKNQAQRELKTLQDMSKEPLKSSDTAYYSQKLKKESYDIDEEEYRPYFEQNSVVKGLFEFLEKLFGIRFESVTCKLWDEKASANDINIDGKRSSRL